jgi:hypothetical protein
MRDLDLVDGELDPVPPVEAAPRLLTAGELLGAELGVLGELDGDLTGSLEGLSPAQPGRP